jgi:hypothetical protein
MRDFYRQSKENREPVPHIMGLTASPIMRSSLEGIAQLETTLDAVCRTPTMHRDELLACVKRPEVSHITYSPPDSPTFTSSMNSLQAIYQQLDIRQDPFILNLKAEGTDRSRRELETALTRDDTPVQNQLKSFCRGSRVISGELGTWAADYYISEVVARFRSAREAQNMWIDRWRDDERAYLSNILDKVEIHRPPNGYLGADTVSEKFTLLLQQLLCQSDDAVGIIFVRERITVAVLVHMLSVVPQVQARYRIGMMIGTSQYSARKRDLWDLSHVPDSTSLQQLRSGKLNLLVATSVLEEGIDVPACNLVICFDEPHNLKSFIQRRGRARMRESKLIVLVRDSAGPSDQWQALEEEMKRRYGKEKEDIQALQALEESDTGKMVFVEPTTAARLDLENAKQHLDHVCRFLSPGEFVDWRPDYITQSVSKERNTLLKAVVLLPTYLPPDVRTAESRYEWKSEKNAQKDAAFQAYLGLYKANLVNDHLLPFQPEDLFPEIESRESEAAVDGRLDPWLKVAEAWVRPQDLWSCTLSVWNSSGEAQGRFDMVLPMQLPPLRPIAMYLDHNTQWLVEFSSTSLVPPGAAAQTQDDTAALLALHFSHRWAPRAGQQVIRFICRGVQLSLNQLGEEEFGPTHTTKDQLPFLVRDTSRCPYIYAGFLPSRPVPESVQRLFPEFEKAPADVPYVVLQKWPRRADFLHRISSDGHTPPSNSKPYPRVLPAPWARVDTIPISYARFGMLIPSIIHEIGTYLTAIALSETLLCPVGISDVSLLLTAISSRSANEPTNYERLEFLGDSLLKLCATINVAAKRK